MVPIRIDGPAVEPVSVDEMRAFLRLADGGAEDGIVASLIGAARDAVEAATGRTLMATRWRARLPASPGNRALRVPGSPLIAVDAVGVRDGAGVLAPLGPGLYRIDATGDPALILIDPGAPVPAPGGAVEIEYRAGYGADPGSVPALLREAVRRLVAHWFEHRGDDADPAPWPSSARALVEPYRIPRL